MVYNESILKVIDNSGVKLAKVIKILNCSTTKGVKPGTLLVVSVQSLKTTKNLKKGSVVKALVVRVKKNYTRYSGISIKFNETCIILLDNQNRPIGSRILGSSYRELSNNKYLQSASLLNEVF